MGGIKDRSVFLLGFEFVTRGLFLRNMHLSYCLWHEHFLLIYSINNYKNDSPVGAF